MNKYTQSYHHGYDDKAQSTGWFLIGLTIFIVVLGIVGRLDVQDLIK